MILIKAFESNSFQNVWREAKKLSPEKKSELFQRRLGKDWTVIVVSSSSADPIFSLQALANIATTHRQTNHSTVNSLI